MENQITSTCFEDLDKYLKGAKKSALIYICAKPGMGMKTFAKAFTEDIEFSKIKGNCQIFWLFEFCRKNEMTISQIKQKVENKKSDGVYIDCLQLIAPDINRENKIQEISEISYQLNQMAKELDVLVVCTVQMPEYEGKPTLKDLLKIGSVVQDADIIMFLHRDDITEKNMDNINPDITELIIAKNNYGDTGVIKLKYNSETKQFTEMDD